MLLAKKIISLKLTPNNGYKKAFTDAVGFKHKFDNRYQADFLIESAKKETIHYYRFFSEDWSSEELKCYVPVRKFNSIIKSILDNLDNIRHPININRLRMDQTTLSSFLYKYTEFKKLITIFDSNSSLVQFDINCSKEELLRRIKTLSVPNDIKEKLRMLYLITKQNEVAYYTIKKTNKKGCITCPLNRKREILVSTLHSNLPVRVEIKNDKLSFYTMSGEFISETFYNQDKEQFLREKLVQERKDIFYKALDWIEQLECKDDIIQDNSFVCGEIETEKKWEIDIHLAKKEVHVGQFGTQRISLNLPKKFEDKFYNSKGTCSPTLLRLPAINGWKLVPALRVDFTYKNKTYKLIYYKDEKKQLRLFSKPILNIKVPKNNLLVLPAYELKVMVDNLSIDSIDLVFNKDGSLSEIVKRYRQKQAYSIPNKKIFQEDKNRVNAYLITHTKNFSYRTAPYINGRLILGFAMTNDCISIPLGDNKNTRTKIVNIYTTVNSANISAPFYNLVHGSMFNPKHLTLFGIFENGFLKAIIPHYRRPISARNWEETLKAVINPKSKGFKSIVLSVKNKIGIKVNGDIEKYLEFGIFKKFVYPMLREYTNDIDSIEQTVKQLYKNIFGEYFTPITYNIFRLSNGEIIYTSNNLEKKILTKLFQKEKQKTIIMERMNFVTRDAEYSLLLPGKTLKYSLKKEKIQLESHQ